MARPVSSLESHPQRQKIIDALVAGSTLSQVAAWAEPKVTESAICRWRRNIALRTESTITQVKTAIANNGNDLEGTLQNAAIRAAMQAAVDPFLSRVAFLDTDRARVKSLAEKADNLSTWAALDRNDLSALELHARLAGRLDAPTQGSSTTFVLMPLMQVSTPEPRQVDAADVVFSDVDATAVPK